MKRDISNQVGFKNEAYRRLVKLFEKVKANKTVDKEKHRLEGFLHAGEYLNFITHSDGEQLLEEAHMQVFGESIQSRQSRKEQLRRAVEIDDEDYFETPAILRNKNTT